MKLPNREHRHDIAVGEEESLPPLSSLTHKSLKRMAREIQRETGMGYISAVTKLASCYGISVDEIFARIRKSKGETKKISMSFREKKQAPREDDSKNKRKDDHETAKNKPFLMSHRSFRFP